MDFRQSIETSRVGSILGKLITFFISKSKYGFQYLILLQWELLPSTWWCGYGIPFGASTSQCLLVPPRDNMDWWVPAILCPCILRSLRRRHLRSTSIEGAHWTKRDNVLLFLDVNVYRNADRFVSTVHRKVTFSGVYSNFNSFMPDTYKRGLVFTLLHRAFQITSSYTSLHEEVEKLKIIFAKNGYPSKFVDKCIFNFFNKIYEKRSVVVDPTPKKEFMLVLPFLGSISWKTKSALIRSFREFVPSSKLKVVFKSSKRLSSYFQFKDSFPKSLTSGVIYKYSCAVCNHWYIGSTRRFFEKRLEEHLHISALTGNRLQGLQVFAPMQHMRSDKCSSSTMSRDEFTIIGRDENPYILTVKESIFISTSKPQLNNNQMSVPLSLFTP